MRLVKYNPTIHYATQDATYINEAELMSGVDQKYVQMKRGQ